MAGLLHSDSLGTEILYCPTGGFCELPGDIHAFLDPLWVVDLLHHEVGYICPGDATAVRWKSVAIDAVGTAGSAVGKHRWHDHRPVKVAVRDVVPLRDLRRYRPLQKRV